MAAKKAPKPAQVSEPPCQACKPVEAAAEGETPKALVPSAQPAGSETSATPSAPEEVQRMREFANIMGRVHRALTRDLTAGTKSLKVLGAITWVVLLALSVGVVVVLIVLAFLWGPVHTILLVTGSAGLVAGSNLITRHLRRGK